MTLYERRDIEALGDHYIKHITAMTEEGLNSKSDIAAELAWRDDALAAMEWRPIEDSQPEPETNFWSFSPVYGYQVSMYSNNPSNSNGLPSLDDLKITHFMLIKEVSDVE